MAKRKISPVMKAWSKYSWPCRQAEGLTNIRKKPTAAQKKKLEVCVMKKARAAGLKIAGWK